MINFTLTITAAPELLAAMTGFTSAITAVKVVTIPEYDSSFPDHKASKVQAAASYDKPAPKTAAEQIVETQAPAEVTPIYNQSNIVPVDQTRNPDTTGSGYAVQAAQQADVQLPQAQVPSVTTSVQSYTMEQLAVAATQIVDAGRRTELVSLLNSFGVQSLITLPKEQYGAFATQLRQLGAKL